MRSRAKTIGVSVFGSCHEVMSTIEIQLPGPILRQARELALQENVSIEHIVALAATQAISGWSSERTAANHARHTSRKRFLDMVQAALDSEQTTLTHVP